MRQLCEKFERMETVHVREKEVLKTRLDEKLRIQGQEEAAAGQEGEGAGGGKGGGGDALGGAGQLRGGSRRELEQYGAVGGTESLSSKAGKRTKEQLEQRIVTRARKRGEEQPEPRTATKAPERRVDVSNMSKA